MPPSPQLNSRQAKHLEFRAAPVPKFLQAFKDKVQPEPTAGSEFDGLLGKGSSSSAKDDGLFPDSEDEADWEGAHVVVLNDKKHLTLEQAREFSKAEPSPDDVHSTDKSRQSNEGTSQAGMPGAPARNKRRAVPIAQAETNTRKIPRMESKNDGMDSVRSLIAGRKAAPPKPLDPKLGKRVLIEQDNPRDRAHAQEHLAREVSNEKVSKEKKKKKSAAARREIKKSGKGLSFDLDD